ncbi:LmeA family phospholipid-binding protein [Streptomyces sp. NPDC001056]
MRRRRVKVLAITVVILAVLFTVADRIALHYADKEAARLVEQKYGYGNSTDSHLDVSIKGFPFLTQAFGQDFDHVALTARNFTVDTTGNAQGGYLGVRQLRLDLRGVTVTSLTARSAEANLVTGTLTLSYDQLSGVLSRLAGTGGPVKVSQAPGSDGQAARLRISGTVGGRQADGTGTLLAQGNELSLTVPGTEQATATWRVDLPENVGFSAARSTPDGVRIDMVGHLVNLGASRFSR